MIDSIIIAKDEIRMPTESVGFQKMKPKPKLASGSMTVKKTIARIRSLSNPSLSDLGFLKNQFCNIFKVGMV